MREVYASKNDRDQATNILTKLECREATAVQHQLTGHIPRHETQVALRRGLLHGMLAWSSIEALIYFGRSMHTLAGDNPRPALSLPPRLVPYRRVCLG